MSLTNREELLNAFDLLEKTRKYGGNHSCYDTRTLYEIHGKNPSELRWIATEWGAVSDIVFASGDDNITRFDQGELFRINKFNVGNVEIVVDDEYGNGLKELDNFVNEFSDDN